MNKINVVIFLDEFLPAKGIAAILRELYFDISFSFPDNISQLKTTLKNEAVDLLFASFAVAKKLDNQFFKDALSRTDIIVLGDVFVTEFIRIKYFLNKKISKDEIYEKLKFYLKEYEETEQIENTLSDREKDILKLVAQGFTNKEIAEKLFLSIHTVTTHRKNISNKLGIKSISGLTIYAVLNGIISIENISEQN